MLMKYFISSILLESQINIVFTFKPMHLKWEPFQHYLFTQKNKTYSFFYIETESNLRISTYVVTMPTILMILLNLQIYPSSDQNDDLYMKTNLLKHAIESQNFQENGKRD